MSDEPAPKPRLVLCPKCWQVLPEPPGYDVYKCGGCGTTLQAKKRKNRAVNLESGTHQTDAAPRNALNLVSDDKQHNNEEQLVIPQENSFRVKATSSSSGECSLDGNGGRGQIENGECHGEQLAISRENGLRGKTTSSSSGECSLDGNGGRGRIENGECHGEQLAISQENGLREKATSSSGECSLDGHGGRGQIENGECHGEQLAISRENGLRGKTTSSSSGECSLDGNGGRGQIENGECHGEQLAISQENGLREKATSSSGECSLDGHGGRGQIENGDCNSQENGLREKVTSSTSGECYVDGSGESSQIENSECNGEQLPPFNLSDEDLEEEMDIYKLSLIRRHRVSDNGCSIELTHSEIEASSELEADNSEENENKTNLQLEEETLSSGNMPLAGAGEESICALDIENTNDEKSALEGIKSEATIIRSDLEGAEELNYGNLLPERAEQGLISKSDCGEVNYDKSALVGASDGEDIKKDQKTLVGAKSEVDITGSASTAKRSSTENLVSQKGSISRVSPCKLEEGTSGNHVSSPNEQRKKAQKNIHDSFDSLTSADTCDTTILINSSSELRGILGEMPKSLTTRSSHAYNSSISSNDAVDERFPTQQLDSFENSYIVANGVSERRSRKGKDLVNSMLYGDLDTQHQSYLPNGKHHVPEDSRGNQNEVPEITRHGHPHWMRTKRDEFPSKMPFHRSGSQSGYESGSPSNQTHDDLYCSSSFLSPNSCEDPEQEKMELLRMVYKLQDQLNRTSYVNGETNGRLSTGVPYKGNHASTYHGHNLHEGRFYDGFDCPRCDGRCGHGINWHQRNNFSCPCVSEGARSTHHVDYSSFQCCPQEWQCSAELLPHVLFHHEEIYKSHPGHNYSSSHCSYPSSPQCFMASKLLYGHETKSDDQRHRAPEVKKYLTEKQNLTKRHYRPVAGGAPFVTCHKCLNLLQLPADFLLFKRVCHQLKCGSCSEVLKFCLQNRSHIVSYAPNDIVRPSCDLDDQNEVINRSNLHSQSHANYYHSSHADPISYSDDYGHSVSKSYSSESDPVSKTPSHPLHGSENDNPSVSHGTFEPITKKKIASRGPSTSQALVETDELVANYSNMSSKMEAQSQPKSSPLHQLMGYSSPLQVIKGIESIVEGKEPKLNGENDLSHNSQQS